MLFDFAKAEILAQLFYLDYRYVVTDFVEEELKSLNVLFLQKLGLQIVGMSGTEMREFARLRREYESPGFNDISVLTYAYCHSLPLLTRDSFLQEAAHAEEVTVYESHVLLNNLIDVGQLTRHEAAEALSIMNRRLQTPRLDWKDLIKQWSKP